MFFQCEVTIIHTESWFYVQPNLRRIPKRKAALLSSDEDETTLDLNMVQIGRFISDGAFNLEVCSLYNKKKKKKKT